MKIKFIENKIFSFIFTLIIILTILPVLLFIFTKRNINAPLNNNKKVINFILIMLMISLTLFSVNKTIVKAEETTNNVWNFDYTGDYQEFIVPEDGKYKIELWGAQGGTIDDTLYGGKGAYTSGVINLNKNDTLYIYVGSQYGNRVSREIGGINDGGYNGGGYANCQGIITMGGGGATDIRLVNGIWNDNASLNSRIMVASGGGGAYKWPNYNCSDSGGYGGGLRGSETYSAMDPNYPIILAATQTTGNTGYPGYQGYFGYALQTYKGANGGGGGSGYYAGGVGTSGAGGAGGSSYISGYLGCVAITSENNQTPRNDSNGNICTDGTNDITCSYHYSGMVFDNAVMKAGNQTIPTHDGTSTMTGNSGNGYAKITLIPPLSDDNYLSELTSNYGTLSPEFNPTTENYKLLLDKYDINFRLSGTLSDEKAYVTGFGKFKVGLGETKNFDIVVTAESGDIRTYTIEVTRGNFDEGEHTSKLAWLDIEVYEETLEPEFHPLTTEYDLYIHTKEIDLNLITEVFDDEASVKIDGNKYLKNETGIITITVTEPHSEDTIYKINYTKVDLKSVYNFDYTGGEQIFNVPITGYYKLETWGAQGGFIDSTYNGGLGDYSRGLIKLYKNEKLYINVGGVGEYAYGRGIYAQGGYNGGGSGRTGLPENTVDVYVSGGGGATHIATKSGLLSTLENNIDDILIVSGGGGGAIYYSSNYTTINAAHGGGYKGCTGSGYDLDKGYFYAYGGTQTKPDIELSTYVTLGSFGQGGNSDTQSPGGGGGFYGGNTDYFSSGGGSGYISSSRLTSNTDIKKSMYCYSCEESNEEETRTISTTNYSSDPVSEYAKQGNGYARITPLIEPSNDNYLTELEVDNRTLSPEFSPLTNEYELTVTSDIDEINVQGLKSDEKATVTGFGTHNLNDGTNEISIIVTSESGDVRTYTIRVTKEEKEHSSKLSNLSVENYELSPAFKSDTLEYNVSIPSNEIDLNIITETVDEDAIVKIEGNNYLKNETGTITITVTEPPYRRYNLHYKL